MPQVTPRWYLHAQTFERAGVLEIPGAAAHPTIISFFNYTSMKGTEPAQSDETPWCSAFACAVMEQVKVKSPKSAAARDWLKWGVPLDKPQLGCVVVFDRPTPKNPRSAHVAFYVGDTADGTVRVLGGNQQNRVCTATYDKASILGYRYPIGEPL